MLHGAVDHLVVGLLVFFLVWGCWLFFRFFFILHCYFVFLDFKTLILNRCWLCWTACPLIQVGHISCRGINCSWNNFNKVSEHIFNWGGFWWIHRAGWYVSDLLAKTGKQSWHFFFLLTSNNLFFTFFVCQSIFSILNIVIMKGREK